MYKSCLAQSLVTIYYSILFVLLCRCGYSLEFLKSECPQVDLTIGFSSFKMHSIVNIHLIQLDILHSSTHQTNQDIYFGTF